MASDQEKKKEKSEVFGYLELPDEPREGWMAQEGFRDKFIRKTKANPFVPIGYSILFTIYTHISDLFSAIVY